MLSAIDSNGNKHFIDDVSRAEQFFCPICQQKLMQKRKGEQRRAHFAHYGLKDKSYTPCADKWHYDMTDWHSDWQLQFPLENYEVVIEADGKKHRADVLINDTVIEFQHSSLSWQEFKERTDFYSAAGYKVIWLFDLRRPFSENRIHTEIWNRESYIWTYVKKPFRDIDLGCTNTKIFVQMTEDNGDACIEYIQAASAGFKEFWTDQAHRQTTKNFIQLVKTGGIEVLFPQNPFTRDSEIDECDNEDGIPSFLEGKIDLSRAEDSDPITIENNLPMQQYSFPPKPNNPPAPDAKTVRQLWDSSYQSMVVQNTINMDMLLIKGECGEMICDWLDRILGTYSNTRWDGFRFQYSYSPKTYVVKDADKSIWKLIYAKKRLIETAKTDGLNKKEPIPPEENKTNNTSSTVVPKPIITNSFLLSKSVQGSLQMPHKASTSAPIKETPQQRDERHIAEISDCINQQNFPARDTDGGRWVKCKICGAIKPESQFISYGGHGSVNLGECKACFNLKHT